MINTEIDPSSSCIGSEALIIATVADPTLEVSRAQVADGVSVDADAIDA